MNQQEALSGLARTHAPAARADSRVVRRVLPAGALVLAVAVALRRRARTRWRPSHFHNYEQLCTYISILISTSCLLNINKPPTEYIQYNLTQSVHYTHPLTSAGQLGARSTGFCLCLKLCLCLGLGWATGERRWRRRGRGVGAGGRWRVRQRQQRGPAHIDAAEFDGAERRAHEAHALHRIPLALPARALVAQRAARLPRGLRVVEVQLVEAAAAHHNSRAEVRKFGIYTNL